MVVQVEDERNGRLISHGQFFYVVPTCPWVPESARYRSFHLKPPSFFRSRIIAIHRESDHLKSRIMKWWILDLRMTIPFQPWKKVFHRVSLILFQWAQTLYIIPEGIYREGEFIERGSTIDSRWNTEQLFYSFLIHGQWQQPLPNSPNLDRGCWGRE